MLKKESSEEEMQKEFEELKKKLSEYENLKKTARSIEQELSIIRDALESSLNGIIITNIEENIVYANKAFIDMFEYSDKLEIIGRHAAEIFVLQKISKFSDVENIINKSNGETSEFNVFRNDGTIFPVEVSTSLVTDTEGVTMGKMAFFIDISSRKRAEDENKRLSSELIKSQEVERQRISKDLHDGIGQTILAAKLNFIAYQKDPEKHKDRFKIGLQFIDKTSQEIREVCNDLYPSILRDYGLESAIKWYSKNYLNLNNIKTDIKINLKEKMTHELEVNLYRIIKEIFSNIIQHSGATSVVLDLLQDTDSIRLKIKDNGIGFNMDDLIIRQRGFGISNIRNRVKELGGYISIITEKDKGTEIFIEVKKG